MASKWRSQQRRQRWEHASVALPASLIHTLQEDKDLGALAEQLLAWGRLPSTFSQVAEAKQLAQTLVGLLKSSSADSDGADGVCHKVLAVYVEVLFLENSKPVHRTLLAPLSQLPLAFQNSVVSAFEGCCRDYGFGGMKRHRFALVTVAISLANLPKAGILKEALKRCARDLALSLSFDLQCVMRLAQKGENPTPAVMEECQDAIASLYYLLQHFPEMFEASSVSNPSEDETLARLENEILAAKKVADEDSESEAINYKLEGYSKTGAFGALVNTVLDVLQTNLMSRDCVVAAGVCLSTAAMLQTSNLDLALFLANSIFCSPKLIFFSLFEGAMLREPSKRGLLEVTITAERRSSLRSEMDKLTDFGKLCVMRGLLTGIPRPALNIPLLTSMSDHQNSENMNSDSTDNIRVSVEMPERKRYKVWTLLFDGILPAILSFCEISVDSHFKFHSITALQICLQQMKASMLANSPNTTVSEIRHSSYHNGIALEPYESFPEASTKKVLKLIWNNWEDPLAQTVKQVQVVFDLLADLQAIKFQENTLSYSSNSSVDNSVRVTEENTKSFLCRIAADLLSVGGHRKGRYVPLASLALRLGAQTLLDMKPDLLLQSVHAFSDDDVCCSANSFLKSFLEKLREECWSSDGIMEGYVKFRRLWVPAILAALLSGNSHLRCNMTTYALPVALQIDGDSVFPMLAFLLSGFTSETSIDWEEIEGSAGLPNEINLNQRVAALISVLKVARALFLLEGEIAANVRQGRLDLETHKDDYGTIVEAVVFVKSQAIRIPISFLEFALTHIEDGLRIDTVELLGLNPKTASMPSYLELYLLKQAIPLNMRCSSTAFRMKWTTLLKKFFYRVRTAVERQIKTRAFTDRASNATCKSANLDAFQFDYSAHHIRGVCHGGVVAAAAKTDQEIQLVDVDVSAGEAYSRTSVTVEDMQAFMKWLSQLVVYSLYPSAPYERKNMAMELFIALLEVWNLSEFLLGLRHDSNFTPYHKELISAECTLVLVGAVVDSWDRLRENAYRILLHYPTPLPGIDTENTVLGLLKWAKDLVTSPRVRESDAGALVLRLLFRKYVCKHAWIIQLHANSAGLIVRSPQQGEAKEKLQAKMIGEASCVYINSLNDWLEEGVLEGEKDLLTACKHSLVHGVLLTLRYTMEEIDWMSDFVRMEASVLQAALKRLLGLLLRVTTLALGVVSADALNLNEHVRRSSSLKDINRIPDEIEMSSYEDGELGDFDEFADNKLETLAPAEQMIMVGCWLSMKEVSLLLGTITKRAPLSGCAVSGEGHQSLVSTSDVMNARGMKGNHEVIALLDAEQLQKIGGFFLRVLFSMKHNGAVDKTRAGFSALCNRLLHAHDASLRKMPEIWLQQLMERTCAKSQTVDDLLRRSAGLPAAFLALFLAEPDGAPRKLLPIAMKWLLSYARKFLLESFATCDSDVCSLMNITGIISNSQADMKAGIATARKDVGIPKAIKSREEGVVPTVHTFNVLKAAFHDTNLATETSGFCAEGLMVAIQAFSSQHWEVRNSATLAFTALVHRTVGFLNVHKRETSRRTITGFEFFNRYPTLHPFLLQELKSATVQLEHSSFWRGTSATTTSNALHPSLAPILIILSRLKPSAINTGVEDWLSPSLFMPLVMRCATQRNLKVRMLASQALPALVSSEKLSQVLMQLVKSLPIKHNTGEIGSYRGLVANEKLATLGYNAIHGYLLQISALLEHNITALADFEEQEKIVNEVFEAVHGCLWLGTTRLCSCAVVTSEFLRVLQALSDLVVAIEKAGHHSRVSSQSIDSVVLDVCVECLDNRTELALRLWDSNVVCLLERAAYLYFSIILKSLLLELTRKPGENSLKPFDRRPGSATTRRNREPQESVLAVEVFHADPTNVTLHNHFKGFMARFRDALTDEIYEVRLATLKVLKDCDKASIMQLIHSDNPLHSYASIFGLDFKQLPLLLIDRLMTESTPRCLNRILRLLFSWQLLSVKSQGIFSLIGNVYLADIPFHQDTECFEKSVSPELPHKFAKSFGTMELWNRLIQLSKSAKGAKMKELIIRCLGGCLSLLTGDIRVLLSQPQYQCKPSGTNENVQPCNEQSNLLFQEFVAMDDASLGVDSACLKDLDTFLPLPQSNKEGHKIDKWEGLSKAVEEWMLLVSKYSAPSEPVVFRRAVAEALPASEMLKDVSWISEHAIASFKVGYTNFSEAERDRCSKSEWYGRAILFLWSSCIKLLEDEDQILRQTLGTSILSLVGSSERNGGDAVFVQVEMVIIRSFNYLTQYLAHWNIYFDFLATWISGSNSMGYLKSGNLDLVRRLFDKEIDNHHEEELLIVQLCCSQLQKILTIEGEQMHSPSGPCVSKTYINEQSHFSEAISSPLKNVFTGFEMANRAFSLHSWRLKFVENATACAKWCNIAQPNTQWLGGITNHHDTFGILYRNLLGLYGLIGPSSRVNNWCPNTLDENSMHFICQIIELANLLQMIPLNPILHNLLGVCLVGYGCHSRVNLNPTLSKDDVFDTQVSEFEPLFLIK